MYFAEKGFLFVFRKEDIFRGDTFTVLRGRLKKSLDFHLNLQVCDNNQAAHSERRKLWMSTFTALSKFLALFWCGLFFFSSFLYLTDRIRLFIHHFSDADAVRSRTILPAHKENLKEELFPSWLWTSKAESYSSHRRSCELRPQKMALLINVSF